MNPFDLSGRVARNRAKSEEAAAMLAALGAASAFIPLDVADPDSCREMVRRVVDRFGRLDILINNAGMSIRKPPEEYTVAEWHTVLDTNLTGPLVCCQAAYPVMTAQGGGKIINIGSMMSIFGAAYAAAYSCS
jgi:2-deoxy-D-gluconate 3-dehydrogenase